MLSFALLSLATLALFDSANAQASRCKCAPGDACWPAAAQWSELNTTVGGNLLAHVPPGAACYASLNGVSTYNQARCSEASRNWGNSQWHSDQPATSMWTLWTNNTCNPSTSASQGTCTLGWMPHYIIMAKTAAHIQAGVKFAKEKNLRLIIRNTGHDFMGRSTGYGSLAINTHSFKTMDWIKNYTGPSEDNWTGGAVKLGVGIQTGALYAAAFNQTPKVVVVGGECATVGITGGYMQGGGHGPMASRHGMGADNALAFEVVTASGELVVANSETNSDLFWALRGGGPGNYGVAVSVTLKTHPEVVTTGANLDISGRDANTMWRAVEAFHSRANDYVEAGMFVYYELFSGAFRVHPFTAPGMTKEQLDTFLQPLAADLRSRNVSFTLTSRQFPTFYEHYNAIYEGEGAGSSSLTGGRFLAKQDIKNNHPAIMSAYRTVLNGGGIIGHIVGPGTGKPVSNTAIHPAWRNASSFSIVSVSSSPAQRATAQRTLDNMGRALREASPNGGSYVNEGDLDEPNWQTNFWGTNYPRLLEIKKKWDPDSVFYSKATPGAESWEVIENNTRLCKKA